MVWILLVASCVAGCHETPLATSFVSYQTVPAGEAEFSVLWETAKDVLRRHHFVLDDTDRRKGRITSLPVGSRHFFEFWRDDVVGKHDFWEATLCPIRRRASVRFDRSGENRSCRIEVIVFKERLSRPERQFNSSAAAFHFFQESLPAVRTGAPIRAEDTQWVDLGRDPAMEARLLSRIMEASRRNRDEAAATAG